MKNNNYYIPLLKPVTKPTGERLILNTYFFFITTGIGSLLCILCVIFSVSFRSILVYCIERDIMLDGVVGASAAVYALCGVKAKLIDVLAK